MTKQEALIRAILALESKAKRELLARSSFYEHEDLRAIRVLRDHFDEIPKRIAGLDFDDGWIPQSISETLKQKEGD